MTTSPRRVPQGWFISAYPQARRSREGSSLRSDARARNRGHSQGIALIVVLFAVALVSIVILAYFNQANLSRNISFSSAGQSRANMIALTALNFVKGDFIAEIQNGSMQEPDATGSGVPIYYPSANTTMVPYRMTATLGSDATIPANLVKWSSGTVPLWSATGYTQAGPLRASSISTATPSLNGHFISNVAWTKPDFNSSASFPASIVPNWVYITRAGPTSGSGLTLGSGATTLNNPVSGNANYVLGRYAYTVYDEGGLVDVAAAGYPSTAFQGDLTDVGRKGSQAFADLTQLGLTTGQADQLITWRNAATSASAGNYLTYLTGIAAQFGFLQAASGDHAFLSRQDFIQYWTNELKADASLLPLLTTFSREANAPSWGPEHDASDPSSSYWTGKNSAVDPVNAGTISYAYHTDQDNPASFNRFFPNVRVQKAFTRLNNDQAVVGEPLVKNRFDLTKLSWITYNGALPDGVSATDIYHYFGLTRNSDGSWTYNHQSTNPPGGAAASATDIMTLDQVSAAAREPDFFEILQAVILQGSMGLCSGDPSQQTVSGAGGEFYRLALGISASAPSQAPLVRSDGTSLVYAQPKYQIIQIGANIIDQSDADNFPTEIILNKEHLYGDENLPYINAIGDTVLRPAPGAIQSPPDSTFNDPNQTYVHHWMTTSLWNPHQNAATPPKVGPATLRIAVTGGEEYPLLTHLLTVSSMGRSFESSNTGITTFSNEIDGPSWIGLKISDYSNLFSEPTAISYGRAFTHDANNPVSTNMNDPYGLVSSSIAGGVPWQRAGIYMGYTQSPDNALKVPLCAGYWSAHPNQTPTAVGNDLAGNNFTSPLTVELQYEDLNTPGIWHTYQILSGLLYSRSSGAGDAYMEPSDPAWKTFPTASVTGAGPLLSTQEYWVNNLLDPRSTRLNLQVIHTPAPTGLLGASITPSTFILPGADEGIPPNGHFPKTAVSEKAADYPGYWASNLLTGTSYYTDRDYNTRVGDAAGWAGNIPMASGATTYRPFHFDRPFRSVAELGYVFRDDPWKTLNFISANSGDTGLLDVFCVGPVTVAAGTKANLPPPDIIAGKLNINSAIANSLSSGDTTSLALQALLSQGLRTYSTADWTTMDTSISTSEAATLAKSLVTYIKANGPLINIGDLPSVLPQDTSVTTQNPGVKNPREAFIRALADSSGTRTWNLMIDVVAQAGRFSPAATSLDNFIVEGEKHYWLHVAIDRFTGKIVDQQLEPVWE